MADKIQLLCTFSHINHYEDDLEFILQNYQILFGRIYVLENRREISEIFLTYNIDSAVSQGVFEKTIAMHRKKNTNTLYTINALNEVIKYYNNGRLDTSYMIDWERFRNGILINKAQGFKFIPTALHDIVEIE